MKNILLGLFILFLGFSVFGQSNCNNAIPLTPGIQQCGTNSAAGDFDDAGGAPTNPCNTSYNDGEYWFEYIGTGGELQLDISGLSATYSGIFVFDDCPSGTPTCIASAVAGSSSADYSLTTPNLTLGATYYIAIINWSAPYSTDFCLDATEIAPPTSYPMTNGSTETTCSGIFMDPQGTNGYIDINGASYTMTFCSGTSDALQFDFAEFDTRENNDNLTIYDGPNTSSPSLGTFAQTNSPGTIISSGTCLTFVWTTDSNGDGNPGWIANISCIAPPPTNFTCANAAALPCGTTNLAGTTVGATDIVHNTGCTMSNYGVWYTFTGDGQQTTITSDADTGFDHEMAITSGSCGSLTNISCHDSGLGGGVETATFITTAGTQYYVYIAYYGTGATMGDFTISRTCTPTTPPANDDCTGAISMTVNADLNCGVVTSGNLSFATASGTPAVYPCGAGNPDDDVWFSFVATSAYHEIEILNVTPFTDMYFSVYSGNCGSLTNILCSDANANSLTGLTIGNTYYVRVYSLGATASNSSFDICVGTPPPPPANDDCSGAIPLVSTSTCSYTTYTNESALASSGVPAPTCSSYSGGDVWFSVVVPTSGHLIFDTQTGVILDGGMSIYSGTCGSLTQIECDDVE